jgi:hypothetical protein
MKRFLLLVTFVLLACNLSQPAPGDSQPPAGDITPQAAPTAFLDPNAPTFYVATDGNDESGIGSMAAPWATITHALDSVEDGSVILVRPGLYTGRVRIRGWFEQGVTVRSEIPYQAQLRADETVLTIFEAQGISIEGFDVAHLSPAASDIVVQIQDTTDDIAGGERYTNNITLRNNILHDSYTNDILKINNGVQQIYVIGNLFYNQGDSDEHIDINSVRGVVVEDNIFFNAFEASGRENTHGASSFIVAKDSNGDEDGIVGVSGLTIRRNIFFHFQGGEGQYMVLLGEDGNEYFEAENVLVENNLFLGDNSDRLRAPFGTKGVHDVVFRNNTISGDMPAGAFFWRSNVEGSNQPNDNIQVYNNIFTDPTGTMENFATAPQGETAGFTLAGNLYWNGGQPLPGGTEDMVQIANDASPLNGDPLLNPPASLTLPVWDAAAGLFGGGYIDIRTVFTTLVLAYGVPQAGSAAIDSADPANASGEDILGQPRAGAADVGAYEVQGNETAIVLPTSSPGAAPPAGESTPVGDPGSASQPTLALPPGGGFVTFIVREGENERIYRIAIAPNAVPEDITARLDAAAPGEYSGWLNMSADGSWYMVSTDRFDADCVGWPCLAVTQDFVNFETVKSGGAPVHAEASALANGGGLIAYRSGGGTHDRDIFAIRREGDAWSAPVELTTASPFANHHQPAFSADGTKVIFACGDDPYASNAICEVNADGTGFAVRFRAEDFGAGGLVFSPVYAPDGSIVFEATWNGEQLWRLAAGSDTPVLISALTNDNSPCILPNGMIVSLWLGRAGNASGYHEIKVMSADGAQYAMLLTGVDVFDAGMGCGAP